MTQGDALDLAGGLGEDGAPWGEALMNRDPDAPGPELLLLRAPNPGPMTLSGTNTYVLRDGPVSWVVDPGPLSAPHLAAVLRACTVRGADRPGLGAGAAASEPSESAWGERLHCQGVLLTHRHRDHAEGAGTLRRQLENRLRADVPLWALDPRAVPGAVPPPELLSGPAGVAAEIIPLPGHTADSLGLLLPGGRMLSGDTLLGDGSSSVISPPDGDLSDHLDSLELLQRLARTGLLCEIHPGHGDPYLGTVPNGKTAALAAIEGLLAHRRARIQEVRDARAAGALTLDRLLKAVYGPDLDPQLRRPAEENLRAILRHLALR